MSSAFHQLCPRYSGTLTPLPLRLLGYGKPSPFLTSSQPRDLENAGRDVPTVLRDLANGNARKTMLIHKLSCLTCIYMHLDLLESFILIYIYKTLEKQNCPGYCFFFPFCLFSEIPGTETNQKIKSEFRRFIRLRKHIRNT